MVSIVLVVLALTACLSLTPVSAQSPSFPLIINTWMGPFTQATDAAYKLLSTNPTASALDVVELGCATCEARGCDTTVGFGGSPDESCETTLDAMIMDGATMKSGAVADLRRIKDAISVARFVLEHTKHTMLAGDQATRFAVQNGFQEESLTTPSSQSICDSWRAQSCQPNYRMNVMPDPSTSCGPYLPIAPNSSQSLVNYPSMAAQTSHDTISMIVIHNDGTMAAGTSTNGARTKIPGRVGDGPITGSGSYVDSDVGGCGATGDGDIMMRFLPCYQALENLRNGMTPTQAADDVLARIARKYTLYSAGIVVAAKDGSHGASAFGYTGFGYSYRQGPNANVTITVPIAPKTLAELRMIRPW